MATASSVRLPALYLATFLCLLVWSGVAPADRFIWVLEAAPAIGGLVVLLATFNRFRFTTMSYTLIWLHMAILVVGAHYTYAEVPAGFWVRDWLGLARNNYDKLGHLAQGWVPAILAREVLIRLRVVRGRGWLWVMVTSLCLAISALYELIEWWTAELTGEAADAFLGTQGYVWDTQSDMAWCLAGALLAQLTLSRWHDRQIACLR